MKLSLDYLIDAKHQYDPTASNNWDLFISAYNDSDRVKAAFGSISALNKQWWIIPEYGYAASEVSHLSNAVMLTGNEREVIQQGLAASTFDQEKEQAICIDITGLMRPHILYLMAYFKSIGICRFDFMYTEPEQYLRKSETRFSIGEDVNVETVSGYIGAHETTQSDEVDILLLGVGYDHHLMAHVSRVKESARPIQLHSFPSLSADMYHESILRLDRVWSERTNRSTDEVFFTSANDPFVTAASAADAISSVRKNKKISNIYLSPLATKAQAVGFGLFYLRDLVGKPASIIYPNCSQYSRETSTGVGRSWIYPIDLSN